MASHPHPAPATPPGFSSEDRNHDVTGWDTAGKGGEKSWYPELPAPDPTPAWEHLWHSLRRILVLIVCGVATLTVIMLLIPHSMCGCHGTSEVAAVQNLKALATAQSQYLKKTDSYANAGWRLNTTGTLIAADFKFAFEAWQQNGDATPPQPKAGYLFRMLQSDTTSPCSYYKDPADPNAGMNTWAATARAIEPGTSGDHQFFITEAGTVYMHDEPAENTPQYKTFLLNDLSTLVDTDGSIDPDKLAAAGWKTAK